MGNHAGKLKITTQTVVVSGNSGQGFAILYLEQIKMIPHFHSGIYNYDYTEASNITVYLVSVSQTVIIVVAVINNSGGGCRNCTVDNPATYALHSVLYLCLKT